MCRSQTQNALLSGFWFGKKQYQLSHTEKHTHTPASGQANVSPVKVRTWGVTYPGERVAGKGERARKREGREKESEGGGRRKIWRGDLAHWRDFPLLYSLPFLPPPLSFPPSVESAFKYSLSHAPDS